VCMCITELMCMFIGPTTNPRIKTPNAKVP
jgi:hypothetical protein